MKVGDTFEYIAGYKVFVNYYEETMKASEDLAFNETPDDKQGSDQIWRYKGVSLKQ